jgi:hypothetical protein
MSKSSWNTSKLPFPSLGSRRFRCARVHSISHRFQSLLNCLYFVPTDARAHNGDNCSRISLTSFTHNEDASTLRSATASASSTIATARLTAASALSSAFPLGFHGVRFTPRVVVVVVRR